MLRSMMVAKLHGLRVTGSLLHYEGSIALDPEHCEAAGMLPLEFVEIWNKTTGARISTYIIFGERGSRCCVLNGAAARTCQPGDELIIAARADVTMNELESFESRTLIFGEGNRIESVIKQRLTRSGSRYDVVIG